MKDTLMILGANTLQIPLIERANQLGYNTLVISPNREEPGHKISKYSEYYDIRDEINIVKLAEKYNICGVITDQTDLPVRTIAYVAEKMELPGNDYSVACLFTDKFLMRERCKELGIKTLKYKLCVNLEDAISFFNSINGAIIIKPIDNQGSKGVYKVSNVEELIQKFQESLRYSKQKKILLEEFVIGQEFVVEGICVNHEFENLIIGDTHYFNIPDVFSATMREFPSQANNELINKILELTNKIISGFNLKQGITHSEFIINGNDIILIEAAARGGGVFISSDLISLQTGLNTEKFLIDLATGKISSIPEHLSLDRSSCYVSFFLPVGKVIAINGIEEICKLDYIYHNNLSNIKLGMKTKPFTDKTARFFSIVSASNHEELMKRVQFLKKKLKIVVLTDRGEQGPIWR